MQTEDTRANFALLTLREISKCSLFLVWFLKTLKTLHNHWKMWLCQQIQNCKHHFPSRVRSWEWNANLSEFLVRKASHLKDLSPHEFQHLNFQEGNLKK